jgi:DNA repair protein RadC
VRLVREGRKRYLPRRLSGPRDVYEFLKDLESLDREVFYSIHLDGKNQVVSCEEVSKGTLTCSLVSPREVYKGAILSSASSIIIAHNHPSGDPRPSGEDAGITFRLYEAGEILGIPLIDSFIIGDGEYHSMAESGELEQKEDND